MLEQIIIIGLLVLAIWYSFQEGEIFGFVSYYGSRLPDKLQQPLYDCNVCMSPWYGSAIYWVLDYLGYNDGDIVNWIVTAIGAMGFNAALNKLTPPEC